MAKYDPGSLVDLIALVRIEDRQPTADDYASADVALGIIDRVLPFTSNS
jgi:hypothetical protein